MDVGGFVSCPHCRLVCFPGSVGQTAHTERGFWAPGSTLRVRQGAWHPVEGDAYGLWCTDCVFVCFFLFKDFIYLFMRDTEGEAETQADGEAGSMQGAQCGTQSRDSKMTP